MCWCCARLLPDISNDYSRMAGMTKRYKDPTEDAFNAIAGFFASVFAVVFFLPFTGLGVFVGWLIWG